MECCVKNPPPRDPFGPIETAVTMLLSLLGAGLALFVVVATFQLITDGHTSLSYATIGDEETCVAAGGSSVPTYSADGSGVRPAEGIWGLRRPDAYARTDGWTVCLKDANAWQWTTARVEPVGQLTFIAVSLLLIRRTIRGARLAGMFTAETARRTRHLGWFILLATLIGPFLSAAGRGVVISAAVRHISWARELAHPHTSVLLIVVALGILSFARILRLAVPLQEEVDATV